LKDGPFNPRDLCIDSDWCADVPDDEEQSYSDPHEGHSLTLVIPKDAAARVDNLLDLSRRLGKETKARKFLKSAATESQNMLSLEWKTVGNGSKTTMDPTILQLCALIKISALRVKGRATAAGSSVL